MVILIAGGRRTDDGTNSSALVEKFTTQLFYAQSISVNLLVNSTSDGLGIGLAIGLGLGIG